MAMMKASLSLMLGILVPVAAVSGPGLMRHETDPKMDLEMAEVGIHENANVQAEGKCSLANDANCCFTQLGIDRAFGRVEGFSSWRIDERFKKEVVRKDKCGAGARAFYKSDAAYAAFAEGGLTTCTDKQCEKESDVPKEHTCEKFECPSHLGLKNKGDVASFPCTDALTCHYNCCDADMNSDLRYQSGILSFTTFTALKNLSAISNVKELPLCTTGGPIPCADLEWKKANLRQIANNVAGLYGIMHTVLPEDSANEGCPAYGSSEDPSDAHIFSIRNCLHKALCVIEKNIETGGTNIRDIRTYTLFNEYLDKFEDVGWERITERVFRLFPEKQTEENQEQSRTLEQSVLDCTGVTDLTGKDSLVEKGSYGSLTEEESSLKEQTYAVSSVFFDASEATISVLQSHVHNSSIDATIEALHKAWKTPCGLLNCDHTNFVDLQGASFAHSLALLEAGASASHMQKFVRTRSRTEQAVRNFLTEQEDLVAARIFRTEGSTAEAHWMKYGLVLQDALNGTLSSHHKRYKLDTTMLGLLNRHELDKFFKSDSQKIILEGLRNNQVFAGDLKAAQKYAAESGKQVDIVQPSTLGSSTSFMELAAEEETADRLRSVTNLRGFWDVLLMVGLCLLIIPGLVVVIMVVVTIGFFVNGVEETIQAFGDFVVELVACSGPGTFQKTGYVRVFRLVPNCDKNSPMYKNMPEPAGSIACAAFVYNLPTNAYCQLGLSILIALVFPNGIINLMNSIGMGYASQGGSYETCDTESQGADHICAGAQPIPKSLAFGLAITGGFIQNTPVPSIPGIKQGQKGGRFMIAGIGTFAGVACAIDLVCFEDNEGCTIKIAVALIAGIGRPIQHGSRYCGLHNFKGGNKLSALLKWGGLKCTAVAGFGMRIICCSILLANPKETNCIPGSGDEEDSVEMGAARRFVDSRGAATCPWMTGNTGKVGIVQCSNGQQVTTGYCKPNNRGEIAQCSGSMPVMCNNRIGGSNTDYICEAKPAKFYWKEVDLVRYEGAGTTGGMRAGYSIEKCQAACENNAACNSFAKCDGYSTGCWMKKQIISRDSPTSTNSRNINIRECRTWYKMQIYDPVQCDTDGFWYGYGQSSFNIRTSHPSSAGGASACKLRCTTDGYSFFTWFSNGGCHCGKAGSTPDKPHHDSVKSGQVNCEEAEATYTNLGRGYCVGIGTISAQEAFAREAAGPGSNPQNLQRPSRCRGSGTRNDCDAKCADAPLCQGYEHEGSSCTLLFLDNFGHFENFNCPDGFHADHISRGWRGIPIIRALNGAPLSRTNRNCYKKVDKSEPEGCEENGGHRVCTEAASEAYTSSCDESFSGNGENYRGCQSRTVSGRSCQKWSVQKPHEHHELKDDNHNLCRNPGGSKGSIWCYTSDSDKEWEKCSPIKLWDPTCAPSEPAACPMCKNTRANGDRVWADQCAFTYCTNPLLLGGATGQGAAVTAWTWGQCNQCWDNYCEHRVNKRRGSTRYFCTKNGAAADAALGPEVSQRITAMGRHGTSGTCRELPSRKYAVIMTNAQPTIHVAADSDCTNGWQAQSNGWNDPADYCAALCNADQSCTSFFVYSPDISAERGGFAAITAILRGRCCMKSTFRDVGGGEPLKGRFFANMKRPVRNYQLLSRDKYPWYMTQSHGPPYWGRRRNISRRRQGCTTEFSSQSLAADDADVLIKDPRDFCANLCTISDDCNGFYLYSRYTIYGRRRSWKRGQCCLKYKWNLRSSRKLRDYRYTWFYSSTEKAPLMSAEFLADNQLCGNYKDSKDRWTRVWNGNEHARSVAECATACTLKTLKKGISCNGFASNNNGCCYSLGNEGCKPHGYNGWAVYKPFAAAYTLVKGSTNGACPRHTVRVTNSECPKIAGSRLDDGRMLRLFQREACERHFTPGVPTNHQTKQAGGCFFNSHRNLYATAQYCTVSGREARGRSDHFALCKMKAMAGAPDYAR